MIVKKMKYIFLLIFTLQNYNFCCEECCNYCEECWNNCWNNSTTDQDFFLHGENSQGKNSQGGNSINNKFHLWKDKNTTKFETTDIKFGICEHDNFFSDNRFSYYEQFYIPTQQEIQEKRNNPFYQNIQNCQNTADFIYKNDNDCVIVKNIFPFCKEDNKGGNNTYTLGYYVSVFLIYKKNDQNVYEIEPNKAFFIFDINKKIYYLSDESYEYMNSWDRKIKERIENNSQNLENIQSNITGMGASINIDLSKKNVSNIIYNNIFKSGKEFIDKNFDLNNIQPENRSWYRKGLENIGATCYMNATLQCFAHIPEFVTFFRKNQQVQDVINKKVGTTNLTTAFAELLQNLYPTNLENKNATQYAPKNFKETISQMNPLFKGIQANDAKDLVNFLIMTLHKELNKANPNQNNNNNEFNQDQRDKEKMFLTFMYDLPKLYKSIISDLFYAVNCNTTYCCNCNTESYNYQIYFFLIFPLEEVRKFKLQNNGFNNNGFNNIFNNNFNLNNNINEVNIHDCFEFERRINYMAGENAMYCNYCKQTSACNIRTHLVSGPKNLIIILNRGKGIQFNVKLNFSENLNLYNYIEYKETGTQYELFGVITHIGESGMSGHFIAYCKDLWDNNTWYKYNDAMVSQVENFQKEVVDFAMPYLLFYKQKEPNNNNNNNNNNNIFFPINNMNPNNNIFIDNNNMFFPN